MAIEIPHDVALFLNYIGVPYPDINEDHVRELAGHVRTFATDMGNTHNAATGAIKNMNSVYSGYSYEQLLAAWGRMSTTHLAELDAACKVVATALDAAAEVITGMKVAVFGELALQAATFASAMAATAVTDGVSLMLAQATETAARKLVTTMEQALIGYVGNEVIEKAVAPLEHVVGNMVNSALHHAAGEILGEPTNPIPLRIEPEEVLRTAGLLDRYADDILHHANKFAQDAGKLDFRTHGTDVPQLDAPDPAPTAPSPTAPSPGGPQTPDLAASQTLDPAASQAPGTTYAPVRSSSGGTPWDSSPSAELQHQVHVPAPTAGAPGPHPDPAGTQTSNAAADHRAVPEPAPYGGPTVTHPQAPVPAAAQADTTGATPADLQHAAPQNVPASNPFPAHPSAMTDNLRTAGTPGAHSPPHTVSAVTDSAAPGTTGAPAAQALASALGDSPHPSGTPWDRVDATRHASSGTGAGSDVPQPRSAAPGPSRTPSGRAARRQTTPWKKAGRGTPELTTTADGTSATPTPWSRTTVTPAAPARVSVSPAAGLPPARPAQLPQIGTPAAGDFEPMPQAEPTTAAGEPTGTQADSPRAPADGRPPAPVRPRVGVSADRLADIPAPDELS